MAKKAEVPKEETAVATTQGTQLASIESQAAQVAATQEIIGSDILIPRLLLMQGISPLVTSRKAQIGDIIRSTTGEKLGNPDQGLDIIPLRMENTWLKFETAKSAGTTKPQFRGQEPRNSQNEKLEWEFKGPEGQDMIRRKAVVLFGLVPTDVEKYNAEAQRAIAAGEAPDLSKTVLPVVITFQSTSFKHGGRQCASFFNNVRVQAQKFPGIAPFQYTLPLSCKEEKNGDNAWYVFSVGPAKPLKDPAIRAEAANWTMILGSRGASVAVDGGEVDEGQGSSGGGRVGEIEV